MRQRIKKILLPILMLTGIVSLGFSAQAAGESVGFGSESYRWELDVPAQIGVYAYSDQPVETAELYVHYNVEFLEYSSGGELVKPETIHVTVGDGNSIEAGTLLELIPRKPGSTAVTIASTNVKNIMGEDVTVSEASVAVDVPDADGNVPVIAAPENEEMESAEESTKVEDSKEEKDSALDHEEKQKETEKQEGKKEHSVQSWKKWIVTGIAALSVLILMGMIFAMMKKYRHASAKKKKRTVRKKVKKQSEFAEDDLSKPEKLEELEEFDFIEEKEIEIAVKNVTMEFKRTKDEATSMKELFVRSAKHQNKVEKFKALDNVSFTIRKGEVVGIIGTNGSGKSTILKIISGALTPTSGTVEVDRDKIQLLTLGTGFDFELTGRENVYLNGAVIGYTKEFIDEKYDDIVKFAELEGFMEQKVRNYSSGMVSRLGFAIATMRDTPEILILDEVLSVGDMFFRKKSEARIKEMIKSGSTVLIVSHSTSVIRSNCTKAIWIEKGVLKDIGTPAEVCRAYEKMNS